MDEATPKTPFADLPELMKQILRHDENAEINIAIKENHRLTDAQGRKMMEIIRKVILLTITPSALLSTIQHELQLDMKRATQLTIDLLGRRFIPMEWYIGDVQSIIRRLGAHADDYILEAKRIYPEVYAKPKNEKSGEDVHPVLENFEQRISTMSGKAEILLRLTGLSSVIEDMMNQDKLARADGEGVMRQLEAVSYAINTHDLNPFEVQSIKRKMKKIIAHIDELKTAQPKPPAA